MHSCRLSLYGHERLPPSQRRQEVARGTVNATQLLEPRQREQLGHEHSMSHATNTTAHLPARGRAGKLQNQSLPQGPTTARLALPHARPAAEHQPSCPQRGLVPGPPATGHLPGAGSHQPTNPARPQLSCPAGPATSRPTGAREGTTGLAARLLQEGTLSAVSCTVSKPVVKPTHLSSLQGHQPDKALQKQLRNSFSKKKKNKPYIF